MFSKTGERQRKRHSYHTIVRYEEEGDLAPRPYLADVLYSLKADKGGDNVPLRLAVCNLHPTTKIVDDGLDDGQMQKVSRYNSAGHVSGFCAKFPVIIDDIDSKCVVAMPAEGDDSRGIAYCMRYSKVSAFW